MNLSNMRSNKVLVLLAALPFLAGCASQQQLRQYQDEIRSLREERTALKKDSRGLRMQLESYEVALADANAKLSQPSDKQYSELDALDIGYGLRGGQFVISVPSEITFASGRADLTRQGKEALEAVARVLQSDYEGAFYWVEGHTDSDPIKKSKWKSNRDLSIGRAMAVLHFLVEKCGITDGQCVVAGHGEYRPLAGNDSKAGKAQNRRVEIVVHGASE